MQIDLLQGNDRAEISSIDYISREDADLTYQKLEEKGEELGYCPLDENAKIPFEHLPATSSVTSDSTDVLTSGGAYTNLVRRLSTSAATGSTTKPVYVNSLGQVQVCSLSSSYIGYPDYSNTVTISTSGSDWAANNYITKQGAKTTSTAFGATGYLTIETAGGSAQAVRITINNIEFVLCVSASSFNAGHRTNFIPIRTTDVIKITTKSGGIASVKFIPPIAS